jgi:primosomal protein N' (replication factor Y) (superfamily II helicase)
MLSSSGSSLRMRGPMRRSSRAMYPAFAPMLFAEVVIDTTTRELGERLFTYHVPDHLRTDVFVGSQVLIPFGNQDLVSGYVVALHDDIAATQYGAERGDARTRPIMEVIESEPLFDRAYISLLHWVAEYYAASISEVIAAAIPSDIGPRSKRVARLVDTPEMYRPDGSISFGPSPLQLGTQERIILRQLEAVKGKAVSLKTLKQRSALPQSKFYAALSALRKLGLVVVENESESKAGPKTVQCVIATGEPPKTKKQEELLAVVSRAGGQLAVAELIKSAGTTHATIKKMCADGVLQLVHEEVIRDPLNAMSQRTRPDVPPPLTPHQEAAFETLRHELVQKMGRGRMPDTAGPTKGMPAGGKVTRAPEDISISFDPTTTPPESAAQDVPWLLHGVTGSGKTEIYLRLIAAALEAGRSALMLVPEISLTPQLAQRLVARFGNQVAVWHSALSAGERYDTWRRLRAGQARVLLGARSAILAALPDVGIIILDEEHDGSYKQSTPSPRYHARTVATERARREGALLVLGSATPDLATYFECNQIGAVVSLPERVFKQALPKSTLVDMREEFAVGNRGIFSQVLEQRMAERLKRNEQIILLMNRRGYASHVFCRACGYVVRCRNCSVSLVYHQPTGGPQQSPILAPTPAPAGSPRAANPTFGAAPYQSASASPEGVLVCHHCAFTSGAWQTCPACHSPFIKQFGLGTQRVEEEVRALFPSARLLRLDSDVTVKRGAFEEIFETFASGAADILIGTQIVAKGLDIARVTLVGVLAADAAFNLPDYRSVERGFQLLTQVSGRAGRGEHPGEVILQTYNLDMPALTLARKQDYNAFAESELASRREFEYPPFSQIVRVVISGEILPHVESVAEQLAEELSTFLEPDFTEDEIKILGPAPCIIDRLRGKFRHHLIVKNLAGTQGREAIVGFLRQHRPPGVVLGVDVDALDLV